MELPKENMSKKTFLFWLTVLLGFNLLVILLAHYWDLKLPTWNI